MIKIIAVGKIKEDYFRKIIEEKINIINKRYKIEVMEVYDEKTIDNPSDKEKRMILKKESDRIIKKLNHDDFIIALDIEGKKTDEKVLERLLRDNIIDRNIVFIIGGSFGLSKDILSKADKRISFSDMTFAHQMVRVLLLYEIASIII
ncbi:MAG: 23S rRNA (pseudouridine(1915)-N(3))-methyltransferase RlmH [Andreesenia angusta]|nr:23S rRNA (pseudouridine(1915)-N(3))-methyltransferase RlmH [Andreesenia angusta]